MKNYNVLKRFQTFEERFNYLKLKGNVGKETFGHNRYLNQILYQSVLWRNVRRDVIIRDGGNDLGCPDYPIGGLIIVHHIVPITVDDIIKCRKIVFDPKYLISTSDKTHNALHYGDETYLDTKNINVRYAGDTCLWR